MRSARGDAAASSPQLLGLGPASGDDEAEPLVRGRALEAGDEVVDALRPREAREEEHVAVALEPARGEHAVDERRIEVEVLRRVDGRVRDADALAALLGEAGAVEGVDLGRRGDDEVAGVLRHRDAVVLREVAREDVRGGAEPALLDARAHDVRDIRPHRLGDRRDVHGQAGAPRGAHGVGDGHRVRAEVEREAHGRHAVGEQLDEPAGDAGEVAPVGHLVVADRLGPLDDDAGRCTAACGRGASAAGRSPAVARSAR